MALEAGAGRLRQASRPGVGRGALALAALATVAAGTFLLVELRGGGSTGGTLRGDSNDPFTLSYPQSWRPLSQDELDALPGRPLAVVRRKDGKALAVLRREGRAPKSFSAFSTPLSRALEKRIPDFQRLSSRIVTLRAGKAFFYSYLRKRQGTVHTVVLIPAGNRSYALNTVSRGSSEEVAREVARIILSFDA
jgi:hypothetical protein